MHDTSLDFCSSIETEDQKQRYKYKNRETERKKEKGNEKESEKESEKRMQRQRAAWIIEKMHKESNPLLCFLVVVLFSNSIFLADLTNISKRKQTKKETTSPSKNQAVCYGTIALPSLSVCLSVCPFLTSHSMTTDKLLEHAEKHSLSQNETSLLEPYRFCEDVSRTRDMLFVVVVVPFLPLCVVVLLSL